jgi:shikimate dehydrogenase
VTPPGPARDRYALAGHPVAHSRSPAIHAEFARATAEPVEYGLIDVPPADFAATVRGFFAAGGRGLNVTVPHKEAAARLVDRLTPRAALAGAVNTIYAQADGALVGDNTDGAGLVRDLEDNLALALDGRRILLLGAGGAARGALGPLLDRRPARLALANRDADRARALAAAFGDPPALVAGGFADVEPPFDLVINATAASLAGALPEVGTGVIGPATVAYDMAYGGPTPFMRWALAHGARAAHDGLGMLVEQAAEAFFVWRGVRPASAPVLARLRGAAPGAALTPAAGKSP